MKRYVLRWLLVLASVVHCIDYTTESIALDFKSNNVLRVHATSKVVTNNTFPYFSYPKVLGQVLKRYPSSRIELVIQSEGKGITLKAINVTSPSHWRGIQAEIGALFSFSATEVSSFTTQVVMNKTITASYPREELCTENLTPWIQLLPCRAHAGIGMFLNPKMLMAKPTSTKLSLVFGIFPNSSFYLKQDLEADIFITDSKTVNLKTILQVDGTSQECPVASSNSVLKVKNFDKEMEVLLSDSSETRNLFQTDFEFPKITSNDDDIVTVHRYLTGVGQVRGGIAIRFSNNHETRKILWYKEEIPYFLRVYYSTLKTSDTLDFLHFEPAELKRPNLLLFKKMMPPKSSLTVYVEFEKVFLALEEHPPDANRGADVIPGVAYFLNASDYRDPFGVIDIDDEEHVLKVQSESLLVPLPVPDFSMPYNVITLSSTVLAFYFGAMLNTLVRRKRPSRLERAESLAKKKPWFKFF